MMNRTALRLIGVCALGLGVSTLPKPATSATSNPVANGQHVYARSCASCHDAHSTAPKVGPGLKGYYSAHHPPPPDAGVKAIVTKGKGKMPALSSLSQEQVNELLAYLKTL